VEREDSEDAIQIHAAHGTRHDRLVDNEALHRRDEGLVEHVGRVAPKA
jgi:hypothetical protein